MLALTELIAASGRARVTGNPLSIVLWVVCLIACVMIGRDKNRLVEGVLLGAFCSCIGLVIMLILPRKN